MNELRERNTFRTLIGIRHSLYLGLENVPWSRPYCRDGGVARWHEGASFGAAQRAGSLGGNVFSEGVRAEADMPSVRGIVDSGSRVTVITV